METGRNGQTSVKFGVSLKSFYGLFGIGPRGLLLPMILDSKGVSRASVTSSFSVGVGVTSSSVSNNNGTTAVFIESPFAQGVAGFFAFLAVFVTVHQVSWFAFTVGVLWKAMTKGARQRERWNVLFHPCTCSPPNTPCFVVSASATRLPAQFPCLLRELTCARVVY